MANYNVDIDVALKGSEALRQLTNELRAVSKEVGKVNAATIKAGKASDEGFSRKRIQNVDNYSKAVAKAERTLRRAAMGTSAEKEAVKALVGAQKEYNQELERQNRLIREEERAQRVSKIIAASDRISARSDISSPVMGARHIEGSPMARDFGFEPKKAREPGGAAAAAAAKITAGQRVGSAVSAGAFPLLFGGGPGMALGGALGGAVSGSTFGPASIALQVLGGAVDTYVAQLTSLADGLDSTQGILSGLEAAGYRVSDSTKSVINSYEDAGLFADAYAIALEEINRVLGPDGAAKLAAYKDETDKLQSEIEKVTGSLKSELLPVFTGLIRVILGAKSAFDQFANSPLGKVFIQGAKQGAFNLVPGLGITEKALQGLQAIGAPTGEPGIPESVRLATEDASAEKITSRIDADKAAREAGFIVDAQLRAAQAGNDLLDDKVVTARENIIQEEYLAKLRKEGITDGERTLAEKEKTLALSRLSGQIQAAATREQEKQTRELERQARETERLNKKKERAIERAIKGADRELESADKAFDRANDQLDKITQKHEDKMAFEREYSRLIMEGSTPAAAKQAIELQKQLIELDKAYDKELKIVDAKLAKVAQSILQLEIEGGVTTEYEKQLELLKKRREELEGKKGKAKGAIEEDLTPETGADKIQAEIERIQGALNDLIDPANQVILAAQAIGDAFSESFRGLITGSMSAQEALANLFSRTADHFADMAAQMIAKQIQMKILGIGLNFLGGAAGFMSPAASPGGSAGVAGIGGGGLGDVFGNTSLFDAPFSLPLAKGGFVSGPTRALIGEGGESEYVVPASKMNEAMGRYARGARGAAVIPDGSGGDAGGEMGGGGGSIDVNYSVERINNVNYVTAAEFEKGMAQAAKRGAEMGKRGVYSDLVNKRSIRSRVGV